MKRIPPMVTLRALREANELTGDQLAERIAEQGVTIDTDHLYNVELGRKQGSQRLMGAWARALGLSSRLDIFQAATIRSLVNGEQRERKSA